MTALFIVLLIAAIALAIHSYIALGKGCDQLLRDCRDIQAILVQLRTDYRTNSQDSSSTPEQTDPTATSLRSRAE